MPRVSREQSRANRALITDASSRLFRERGIAGVSVADLMAAAGLTHGGFYGHFESKAALATEACNLAFERSADRWRGRVAAAPDGATARNTLIDAFLSAQARVSPGTACPTTTLAGDVAREPLDSPVRRAFADGLESLMRILEPLEAPGKSSVTAAPGDARQAALADFATLVGGLLLARATLGHALSDEFLDAARRRLKTPDVR